VDRVTWLIRYLAEESRNRHDNGTLFDRYRQDRTPARTKALTVAALVVLGAAALAAFDTAVSGAAEPRPLWAFLALLGGIWSMHTAARLWLAVRREDTERPARLGSTRRSWPHGSRLISGGRHSSTRPALATGRWRPGSSATRRRSWTRRYGTTASPGET
jgi:hypothetical protein